MPSHQVSFTDSVINQFACAAWNLAAASLLSRLWNFVGGVSPLFSPRCDFTSYLETLSTKLDLEGRDIGYV